MKIMQSLYLRCTLQRCNVDGSSVMSLEKCALSHSSPCYYMTVKENEEEHPEDAWKKFDHFVTKQTTPKKPPSVI